MNTSGVGSPHALFTKQSLPIQNARLLRFNTIRAEARNTSGEAADDRARIRCVSTTEERSVNQNGIELRHGQSFFPSGF